MAYFDDDDDDLLGFDEDEDRAWQEMREEAHRFAAEQNETALKRWFDAIGFKGTVGYYNNLRDRIFTIYTTHPGVLIGKGGSGVETFEKILNEMWWPKCEYKVEFVEIRGGFFDTK